MSPEIQDAIQAMQLGLPVFTSLSPTLPLLLFLLSSLLIRVASARYQAVEFNCRGCETQALLCPRYLAMRTRTETMMSDSLGSTPKCRKVTATVLWHDC